MKSVDELIRGEMAAVESINRVLDKVKEAEERSALDSIRQDHERAVNTLKQHSTSQFNGDTESSGPWGTFAQSFTGGASLFGDKAALGALKVGEEYGCKEYQAALESDDINQDLKNLIRSELLPNQERHLTTIDRYMH